jgi:GTP cyclohydrolase-4
MTPPGLPDIAAEPPDVAMGLNRVGVSGVRKLVEIARSNARPIVLISNFDLYVDLPDTIKGANLSRNFEAINDVLNDALRKPVLEMEGLCNGIVTLLMEKHEYANRAEVKMRSTLMVRHQSPVTGLDSDEAVEVLARSVATRDGDNIEVEDWLGTEVEGITACPCAQSLVQERAKRKMLDAGLDRSTVDTVLELVPMATHNQRSMGSIWLKVPPDGNVRLEPIIRIIEASQSSTIYEILKRPDELEVVWRAHQNPKFVEDCVRDMARRMVEKFPRLPDDTWIMIRQTNQESIHRHDVFAERVATMGELRDEVKA